MFKQKSNNWITSSVLKFSVPRFSTSRPVQATLWQLLRLPSQVLTWIKTDTSKETIDSSGSNFKSWIFSTKTWVLVNIMFRLSYEWWYNPRYKSCKIICDSTDAGNYGSYLVAGFMNFNQIIKLWYIHHRRVDFLISLTVYCTFILKFFQ